MNDELETRLRESFRGQLPAAPASLAASVDEVTTAPVTRGAPRVRGRGLSGRRFGGLLAAAAILLVGGAVAFSVGGRGPNPGPVPSASPSPSSAAATTLTYDPQWTAEVPQNADVLEAAATIARRRVDAEGLVGVRVATLDETRIVVEVPAGIDLDPVRKVVGTIGVVGFVPLGTESALSGQQLDPDAFKALFDGTFIVEASYIPNLGDLPTLQLTLREPASSLFADYTAAHIGEYFSIVVDGIVVVAPVIQSEITGGSVEITAAPSDAVLAADLAGLAAIISSGPLPVALVEITSEPTPSATASAAASPPIHCEAPVLVEGSQLTCDDAVRSALAILPPDHPAIAAITFNHSCNDVILQPAPDCAIQLSGTVEVTFADGSRPVRIAVRLGSSPSILSNLPSESVAPMTLNLAPADLGCDAMRPPYDALVIHIDPSAADPIWAVADTGVRLRTFWAASFRGEAGADPVVLDSHGVVVARDGTRIDIPDGAWPTLDGYFVCPSTDAIYVLARPPS
jgi:hypothetical protein